MNSFERQAYVAPPPSPFTVVARYGTQGKFKVWAYGRNHIMTREQAIKMAKSARAIGAAVTLNGLISLD